jgi:hypothetical protein
MRKKFSTLVDEGLFRRVKLEAARQGKQIRARPLATADSDFLRVTELQTYEPTDLGGSG